MRCMDFEVLDNLGLVHIIDIDPKCDYAPLFIVPVDDFESFIVVDPTTVVDDVAILEFIVVENDTVRSIDTAFSLVHDL